MTLQAASTVEMFVNLTESAKIIFAIENQMRGN